MYNVTINAIVIQKNRRSQSFIHTWISLYLGGLSRFPLAMQPHAGFWSTVQFRVQVLQHSKSYWWSHEFDITADFFSKNISDLFTDNSSSKMTHLTSHSLLSPNLATIRICYSFSFLLNNFTHFAFQPTHGHIPTVLKSTKFRNRMWTNIERCDEHYIKA